MRERKGVVFFVVKNGEQIAKVAGKFVGDGVAVHAVETPNLDLIGAFLRVLRNVSAVYRVIVVDPLLFPKEDRAKLGEVLNNSGWNVIVLTEATYPNVIAERCGLTGDNVIALLSFQVHKHNR